MFLSKNFIEKVYFFGLQNAVFQFFSLFCSLKLIHLCEQHLSKTKKKKYWGIIWQRDTYNIQIDFMWIQKIPEIVLSSYRYIYIYSEKNNEIDLGL